MAEEANFQRSQVGKRFLKGDTKNIIENSFSKKQKTTEQNRKTNKPAPKS